jgi:hypothetical protein
LKIGPKTDAPRTRVPIVEATWPVHSSVKSRFRDSGVAMTSP